ncbi:MAG: NAD-binding protein [Promethearchaeota archaeon]
MVKKELDHPISQIRVKLRQLRFPIYILLGFFIIGFIIFYLSEVNKNLWNIFLISACIRSGESGSDFLGFYQLIYPMILDVTVFGILISVLLDYYNPKLYSKKKAHRNKNHTVILGYNHLSARMILYLRKHNLPYAIIEDDAEKLEDLINAEQPAIIGDPIQEVNLKQANVQNCKEVFVLTNDPRESIISAEKIRKMNPNCDIYVRVFDEHFHKYLKAEPWHAYGFSTSRWSLDLIKKWKNSRKGKSIILGNNNIAKLIVEYLSTQENNDIYLIDSTIEVDRYKDKDLIHAINDSIKYLENLEQNVDLNEINQIFICWESEESFATSMLLSMELSEKYPKIKKFMRIYDDELAKILEKYNVIAFSTSARAFGMLRDEVSKNSSLSLK